MEAAARLHALVVKGNENDICVSEDGKPVANVTVSADGTWQRGDILQRLEFSLSY